MKNILPIILSFIAFNSIAQSSIDCFSEVKTQINLDTKKFNSEIKYPIVYPAKRYVTTDSTFKKYLDSAVTQREEVLKRLIGCVFPKEYFTISNGKELTIDSIQSNLILLNFNYLYDDKSLAQLDDFVKLKKENEACEGELNENITIISFFSQDKSEIQYLIDKYKNEITFVPEASIFIDDHCLGHRYPLNYLLEQKKIKCIKTEKFKEEERLYTELKAFIN